MYGMRLWVCSLLLVLWGALPVPRLMSGETQPWSPNKPPLSPSSAEHLRTWDRLSSQFEETLRAHEETLSELSRKLEASESNGQRLTGLFERLSRQNEDLKQYNEEIGERMQERDLDLVKAYQSIDRLGRSRLQLIIACGILGFLLIGLCVLRVMLRLI